MTCTSTSACPPTSPRSTSPAPAWDDSSTRDSSNNPDAAAVRNGLNVLWEVSWVFSGSAALACSRAFRHPPG